MNLPKKRDIFDYGGTILLSIISFNGFFLPIVIGLIEKRAENLRKKVILYAISIATVTAKFYFRVGIEYLVNVILILAVLEALSMIIDRNVKIDTYAVFLATLASSLLWDVFQGILAYDAFVAIITGIAAAMGYLLFNKFEFNFKVIDEKNFIILISLLGVVIAATDAIKISFIEIKNILAVYIVLNLAYLKGARYAALSGIIIGTIMELVSPNMGVSIISLSIGGLIASIFSTKSKSSALMGFMLGNSVLAYYITGYNILVAKFAEILIAGLIFIISSKKINEVTGLIHDDVLMLKEGDKREEYALKAFAGTSDTLNNMSDMISRIEYKEDRTDIFDIVKNKICAECKYEAKCWNEKEDQMKEAIFSGIEEMGENGALEEKCFEDLFPYEFCEKKKKIIDEISDSYNRYKIYKKSITFEDLKRCMANQLKGISQYLSNMTGKVREESKTAENKIIKNFENENIPVNKLVINTEQGECNIRIQEKSNLLKSNISKANLILSQILSKRIINIDESGNNFKEATKLKIVSGIATASAKNQKVSGDTYKLIDFYDDKYIMILSDGMGIGESAAYMSNLMVEMFSGMVKSDFDMETITTLTGSFMQYISDSEKIITLDSTSINLITGECEFIKIGGAPTFIMRKDSIDIICCDTLPMGIFEAVDFYREKQIINSGDIIVSVTDGVIDSKRDIVNKEFWISGFLKRLCIDEPQIIAEELMAKTIENYGGDILDDATIIVQKVI